MQAVTSFQAFSYEVLNRTAKIYPEASAIMDNVSMDLLNLTLKSSLTEIANDNVLDPALGSVQSHLVLSLAFAWILVYFGVSKGIGSIGWAVSITSTLPYLLVCLSLYPWFMVESACSKLCSVWPNIGIC